VDSAIGLLVAIFQQDTLALTNPNRASFSLRVLTPQNDGSTMESSRLYDLHSLGAVFSTLDTVRLAFSHPDDVPDIPLIWNPDIANCESVVYRSIHLPRRLMDKSTRAKLMTVASELSDIREITLAIETSDDKSTVFSIRDLSIAFPNLTCLRLFCRSDFLSLLATPTLLRNLQSIEFAGFSIDATELIALYKDSELENLMVGEQFYFVLTKVHNASIRRLLICRESEAIRPSKLIECYPNLQMLCIYESNVDDENLEVTRANCPMCGIYATQ